MVRAALILARAGLFCLLRLILGEGGSDLSDLSDLSAALLCGQKPR